MRSPRSRCFSKATENLRPFERWLGWLPLAQYCVSSGEGETLCAELHASEARVATRAVCQAWTSMRLKLLLAKYLTAGLINTLIGYAVIFGCMASGLDPKVSNVSGYGVGFVASFVQSRYWVFRSRGGVVGDGLRFILAFLVAFGANLVVLHEILEIGANPYLAQLGAGLVYVGVGFSLNYVFVFRKRND